MAKIGDDVIRPMMRALDDAPIHLRSLRAAVIRLKTKQGRNRDGVDDLDKTPEGMPYTTVNVKVKEFKQNPKHNSEEYTHQYNEQMNTLQSTPLADWIRNRKDFLENGRTSDSVRAQRDARNTELNNKFNELRDSGLSKEDAQREAAEWLKTKAATHRLDGIAGGNMSDISGVGDSGVNSSLGSQWKSRVGDIDIAVADFVNNNPGVDLNSVFINVTFR